MPRRSACAWKAASTSRLRPTLISLLAGPIAEHRFTNGHVVWARNDLNTAFAFRPHVEGAGTLER